MLKDAGATAVIVGHSERRADHGETDAMVRTKAEAAHRAGLAAIVCVGETAGRAQGGQGAGSRDGTARGLSPERCYSRQHGRCLRASLGDRHRADADSKDVAEVHAAVRQALVERYGDEGRRMRILYGGSVKPSNARELLSVANVNGALVGGASLKAEDFLSIVAAYA